MITHDYRKHRRTWGHDYTIHDVIDGGHRLGVMGWGHGLSEGDYILFTSRSTAPGANPDTRYRIKTIEYFTDPADMWTAELDFAPREPTP
jgi:hypothetical protein